MIQVILILTVASTAGNVADDKATLSGVVLGEKGKPIAGAMVRISTAGPRKGAGDL